jgi:hypothetical protein
MCNHKELAPTTNNSSVRKAVIIFLLQDNKLLGMVISQNKVDLLLMYCSQINKDILTFTAHMQNKENRKGGL